MAGYVVRRLLAHVRHARRAVSIVTFLMFAVIPADPARLSCGKACTPEIIEANRALYGIDKPITQQYVDFAKGLVVGRTYGEGADPDRVPRTRASATPSSRTRTSPT